MGNVDLPSNWVAVSLGDTCEIHDNLREPVNSAERAKRDGPYPYYGATGQVGWIDDFRQDGEYILLGEDGAPFFDFTKGKAYLVSGKCWVNNHAHVLKGKEAVCLNRYLLYALNEADYRGYANGTTRPKLTQAAMRRLPINLAPLPEQHRIIAKIEELFSELDKGIESMKTAQAQIKVYRQALLKHAFEGKLTAQWRADNPDKLETADALRKRIQQERAQRYQQQLAEWEVGGKQASKPKAPKPPTPLSEEALAELPHLPYGWGYTELGTVIDEPTYGTAKKCDYETEGVGVLRIPNVVSGKIDPSDLKFAQFSEEEIATYKVVSGDLLIIRSNGSVSIVGRCALVSDAETEYLYAGYLIRLRPNQRLIVPAYLLWTFSTHSVRKQIEKKAKSTSGVNNINTGEIQSLAIALCGIEEQQQILIELECRLSEVDQLDQTISASLQQAEALRHSILKKAFSGQLVPQDPNDEPAAVLLARIEAEKSAQPQGKKARK
jgi:type I restriction enzyme S subunit